MKFSYPSLTIAAVWIFLCPQVALSIDDIGTPSVYKITMLKVELCSSSACSNSTVIANSASTFDIASVSAGANVGSWVNNFSLAVGKTYTHVKATMSSKMVISGYTTNSLISSDYCVTNSNPVTASTHTAPALTNGSNSKSSGEMVFYTPNMISAWYGDQTSLFSSNGLEKTDDSSFFTFTEALSAPYTASATSTPKIKVTFDVTDQLRSVQFGANTCNIYVLPASSKVTIY